MNHFLKFLHSFTLTINAVVVILLLICGFAYKIKPEYSFIAAFLGYGFPIFAIINLFFIFYWLVRMKGWILISLVGLILTYSSYQAWFPINFKTDEQLEESIKVLSYNIMYLGYEDKQDPGTLNPIFDYIRDNDADIVCLQEAGPSFVRMTTHDPKVMEALKAYPYICSGERNKRYSVVLLSKYPVIRFHRIDYVSQSNSSFCYDLKIGEDTVRVINNHLESNKLNKDDKNKYKDLLVNRESDKLKNVAEVLGSKVGNASFIRSNQADSVSKVVSESPYKVIVCGDFNDVPGSYTYRTVRKGIIDAWVENGKGWGNTFHENLFLFRIDFIMHSPSIKSARVKVDKLRLSDHYPIWTNLVL